MVEVETSLLNVKEEDVIKTIYDLEVGKTNYFHIDVMDGKFVENDTIEIMRKYTEYIKNISNVPIKVHLMVQDVDSFAKTYLSLDVNTIIFHIESLKNENKILETIAKIKEENTKVGICIKPSTNIEDVYKYLPFIHEVLVMTVEPGKGGQEFMEDMVVKIQKLNIFAYENGYDIDISVDGGINEKTSKKAIEAGANDIVAGTYIIKSEDYKTAIFNLKNI